MTTFTEDFHAGAFIVSEGNGCISRDRITVLSGQNLKAGAVIGKVTLGAGSSSADGGNTGNGTMGAITVGALAQAGDYVLTITEAATNAGTFQVVDPQGDVVGLGVVGAAFSGGGISFTLADGGTDFAVGDSFTITVAAGSGKYVEYDNAGTDGRQIAAGILHDAVDASSADKAGVAIVRDAEVAKDALVWKTGASSGDKTAAYADLAALNIIARD